MKIEGRVPGEMVGGKIQPDPRKIPAIAPRATHYEILGVESTASMDELGKAWQARVTENAARALARGIDKTQLAAYVKKVNDAHNALINEMKRAAYDRSIGLSQ